MSERVCAVIVTYNRKDLLRECLNAVLGQTRPPDHVLVVDNASTDGTPEMLQEEFSQVEVLRLSENLGGAGGFHEGMKRAYEMGFDWLWIMDDDALPMGDVIERLLEHKGEAHILVPLQESSEGVLYGLGLWRRGRYVPLNLKSVKEEVFPAELFAFVGPLISRMVVSEIGFPRREFFIWFDDWEFALRALAKGFRVLGVRDAVIRHDYGRLKEVGFLGLKRRRVEQAPWKVYYGVRNRGWTVLHTPYAKPSLYSLQAFLVDLVKGSLGDILFEDNKVLRLKMRWLGAWHAACGRLGKTLTPPGLELKPLVTSLSNPNEKRRGKDG